MEMNFCASCYLIDYETKELLLINNNGEWIKPGGCMIEGESPYDACVRGTLEMTGINCLPRNTIFENDYISPIDIKEYRKGDNHIMDIEYLAIPLTKDIDSSYDAKWFSITELVKLDYIDDEIKYKANELYKLFKNDQKKKIRRTN